MDELGLPVAKTPGTELLGRRLRLRYRQKIVDGVEYTRNGVDIQHLLQAVGLSEGLSSRQATTGNWFWYRGGLVVPGCPDWGARWLIFELPDSNR